MEKFERFPEEKNASLRARARNYLKSKNIVIMRWNFFMEIL